jgi:hypothetical protein
MAAATSQLAAPSSLSAHLPSWLSTYLPTPLRFLVLSFLLPPLFARFILPRLLTLLVAKSSLVFRGMKIAGFDEKGLVSHIFRT